MDVRMAHSSMIAAVISADDLIIKRLLPVLSKHATTLEVFRALRHLCADVEATGLTVGDLARVMATSPPATTRIVDKMVTEGLAYRRADAVDRRRVLVAVSEAGRTRWAELLRSLDD